MEIIAKVYSGYKETYKRIYKDVVERVYKLNGININKDEIIYEVEVLEGDTVQSQRSKRVSSRTITILENGKIKYIVGLSNTGYDDDKLLENPEFDYGHTGYHANTYFVQGCNKIFDYYLREKEKNSNIKLYFYMLDVNQSHPHDKFNLMIYRKLATIGFDVLNIEQIKFDEYIEMGFSIDEINAFRKAMCNGTPTVLKVEDYITTYTVTQTLSNCTSDNAQTSVAEGESLTLTISPNANYKMSSITVTMGGTNITSSVVSGNTINIANVTGNVVITATAS